MPKPIEEFTDKELEKAVELHEELIKFYGEVIPEEQPKSALEMLGEFLEKLNKERDRRKSYNNEEII
jgi:hypothetical protein